jgi:tRNA modification GTPase
VLQSLVMFSADTIAAIATAPGVGAIAIVRLSGPDAFAIGRKVFLPMKGPSDEGSDIFSRTHVVRYGYIRDPETEHIIDEVVLIPYRAPASYTGEDMVEINCHGGSLITHEILQQCLKHGARIARAGEFTQRAFLSGRLDLTQAEAVLDLIQAKTSRQSRIAVSTLSGHLGGRIRETRKNLIALLSSIVAGIDFPEEVGDAPVEEIRGVIAHSLARLEELNRTARSGRFLREGVRLAIVGRPNAGKSSLLNQLLKFDRAIVTEIPGTTRDSLEELVEMNGVPVILIDTAGIRHTEDAVEKIGIERTHAAIDQSDLVLLVVDLTQGWGQPEEQIMEVTGNKPYLAVCNKLDVARAPAAIPDRPNCIAVTNISALTGEGIEQLNAAVENWVFSDQSGNIDMNDSLNARQAALCGAAAEALKRVTETVDLQLPQDCLAVDLKSAVDCLSEMCGEAVSEEVIHEVFANFCIGK